MIRLSYLGQRVLIRPGHQTQFRADQRWGQDVRQTDSSQTGHVRLEPEYAS